MKSDIAREVIACLPRGKTHYRYYKGAYAPKLLSLLINGEAPLRALKHSRFKGFVDHPLVKPIAAACGNGALTQSQLNEVWREPSLPFLLTVRRWGDNRDRGWYQTSRFGENLVLQLNLSKQHWRMYTRYIDKQGKNTINGRSSMHPVQRPARNPSYRDTLAWARIDFDFSTGEALIEEIQSDAVRNVASMNHMPKGCECAACSDTKRYIAWFNAYSQVWSEAMLMASIEFIQGELGIDRIFYHTDRSGWQLKKMDRTWRAPKSLYSDLPRKFGFTRTWAAPEFLQREKTYQRLIRKQPDIDFYRLYLDQLH